MLQGEQHGMWTLLAEASRAHNRGRRWVCRCECGQERVVREDHMQARVSLGCGCTRRLARLTHGQSTGRTPEYKTWCNIIQRCTNPRRQGWKNYGGRGIAVCSRWRQSFEAFFADMGQRPLGKTIERKDNDGPYSPENCVWATMKEQAANKRPKTH